MARDLIRSAVRATSFGLGQPATMTPEDSNGDEQPAIRLTKRDDSVDSFSERARRNRSVGFLGSTADIPTGMDRGWKLKDKTTTPTTEYEVMSVDRSALGLARIETRAC